MTNLEQYGFDSFFKKEFESFQRSGFEPGRVTAENKQRYNIITCHGEITGEVTGKFLYNADDLTSFPKTGDWVAVTHFQEENKCIIHNLLNRRSHFSRGQAGKEAGAQVIAANLDFLFIVQSFNHDFSINRIERYLVMAEEGNCSPAIIINKNDLMDNPQRNLDEIRKRSGDIPLFSTSCETGKGFKELKDFILPGKTYALAGSSGVGKSSIINFLMDETILRTSDIQSGSGKGKHTTTRRELFLLPEGGIIMDTPGMREFALWNNNTSEPDIFSDITGLAGGCRFKNCTHTSESGCAVISAVEKGVLSKEHLDNYFKLKKESEYLDSLIDRDLYLERKKKEKRLHREIRRYNRGRKSKGDL